MTRIFIPTTPAGTLLMHITAENEDAAWMNLQVDAPFLPYVTRDAFKARGYTVQEFDTPEAIGE